MPFACVLHFTMSSSAFHLHVFQNLHLVLFPRCPFRDPTLPHAPVAPLYFILVVAVWLLCLLHYHNCFAYFIPICYAMIMLSALSFLLLASCPSYIILHCTILALFYASWYSLCHFCCICIMIIMPWLAYLSFIACSCVNPSSSYLHLIISPCIITSSFLLPSCFYKCHFSLLH